MSKVIHLVPYDGIGGVETAARSMTGHCIEGIDFLVHYIYPPDIDQRGHWEIFNPLSMLQAVRRVLDSKPDLLIVSLWRSCIVGIIAGYFRPRLRVVLFLHLPKDVHWIDRLVTRWMAARADHVWADSQETLDQRLPSIPPDKGRVISFVTRRVACLPDKTVNPVFIFWGRLHSQKGLDRALALFSSVHAINGLARFIIVGPDGGDLERINAQVKRLGLMNAVCLTGGMNFDSIRRHAGSASFYLQTSLSEGMAMSVVEAMQLGLVPVVTPVGEIGNYCRDGENALVIQTDEAIVEKILAVLGDDAHYQILSARAVATWSGHPLYAESVLEACADILLKNIDKSQ